MRARVLFSFVGALVAAVALVSASGAATTKSQKATRIDLSTRAAVVHYLRSIHVNAKEAVIERGGLNYAGAHCPGTPWTCASTKHTVVQIAKRGGENRFVCTRSRCAVVQFAGVLHGVYIRGRSLQSTAGAAKSNKAVCVKTVGLGASCSITQSNATADNQAYVFESAPKSTGLTQSALYTATIKQTATGTSNGNTACVTQNINLDGSTNAKKGTPVTVTLEAHQSVTIKQDVTGSGANNAVNGATSSTSGSCDTTQLGQNQTLNSIANGTGPITQNENDQFSACGDGVAGDYANLCLDIEQNQGIGKGVATGPNNATFTQASMQTAVANTSAGPSCMSLATGVCVSQTQSSTCSNSPNAPADCLVPGGLVGTVNQDSTGISTANPTQTENQCEDATTTSGNTVCRHDSGDADFSGPYSLTQNQYGPVGVGKLRNHHHGRQLYGHLKGLGTSTQSGGNSGDTFTINQTSTQDNDQGSGGSTSNQTNTGVADCRTSGNCTATQNTSVNGQTTNNTQTGQSVSTSTNCTGSTCTTTGVNTIVGNNAAFGGGPIQTWDLSTGSLVNSFVPDGAQSPDANGRAVAVEGNEIYYSELSNGFGASDGIHVAPFNGGAGGSDLRVLPNPAPTTGIQDLAFANGNLYALTGYPNGTLQVWELNPSSGAVIAGPVAVAAPDPAADGFTVLPDGSFLINDGDMSCTYRGYNPSTGAPTGKVITVPGGPTSCTGVETDGSSLYFETNFDSFTTTDSSGTLVATTNEVGSSGGVEDVSLG
jgi:hypothetical protein